MKSKTATNNNLWLDRIMPLYEHFENLGANMMWQTDTKGVIIQYWHVFHESSPPSHYLVYIWKDGSGWNVFGELESRSGLIEDTLAKIT